MATCEVCETEMLTAGSCVPDPLLTERGPRERIRYGQEDWLPSRRPPPARCGDCGVAVGGYHHPGCDLERCVLCLGQRIMCGCEEEAEDAMLQ